MLRFLYISYAIAPVAKFGNEAAEREAKRLAAFCNQAAGAGPCTVGEMPCPFLIHGFENDTGNGMTCSVITPDDWLKLLEVK